MKELDYKPKVKLIGEDGNVFIVMAKAKKALKDAGADEELLKRFFEEATSGDYTHVLATIMKYCEVV